MLNIGKIELTNFIEQLICRHIERTIKENSGFYPEYMQERWKVRAIYKI